MSIKLCSIEIENFKVYSGVVKVESLKQFNVLTGTNGSGKSNFLDAISFALGEDYKKLRAKSYKNLIHNSVHSLIPKRASVTVVIQKDNTNWQFSRSIIEDSCEYKINNNVVTDYEYIQQLKSLMINLKTLIVYQGTVESIATKSPKDLTEFLEEFCGSKQHEKEYSRLKAEMDKVNSNVKYMTRKKDNLLKTIKKLKTYIQEIDRMKELKDQLKEKQKIYQLFKLYYNNNELRNSSTELGSMKDNLERMKNRKSEITGLIKELKRMRASLFEDICKTENNICEIEKKKLHFTKEFIKYHQHVADTQLKLENVNSCIKELKKSENVRIRSIEEYENELHKMKQLRNDTLLPQSDETKIDEEQMQEYYQLKNETLRRTAQLLQEMESLKRSQQSKEDELYEINEENSAKRMLLNLKKSEKIELETRLNKLTLFKQSLEEKIKQENHEKSQYETEIVEMKANANTIQEQLNEVLSEIALYKQDKEIDRKNERLNELKKIFGEGVLGRLVNLCKPNDERFNLAITKIIGRHMDSIVVNTELTARKCIEYLRNKQLGIETFLPIDSLRPKKLDTSLRNTNGVKLIYDTINFDEHLMKIILFVTNNVIVCETDELAKFYAFESNKKYNAVTLEGVYYQKSGLISGGMVELLKKSKKWEQQHVVQLKQKKESLLENREKIKVIHIESQLKTTEINILEMEKRMKYIKTEEENILKEIQAVEIDIIGIEEQIQNTFKQKQVIESVLTGRNAQLEKIKSKINAIEDEIFLNFCSKVLVENIRQFEEKEIFSERKEQLTNIDKQIDRINNCLDYEKNLDIQKKIYRQQEIYEKLQNELETYLEKEQKAKQELNELKDVEEHYQSELLRINEEINKLNIQIKEENSRNKDIIKKYSNMQSDKMLLEAKIEKIQMERHEILMKCYMDGIEIEILEGNLLDIAGLSEASQNAPYEKHLMSQIYELENDFIINYQSLPQELQNLEKEAFENINKNLYKEIHEIENELETYSQINTKAEEKHENLETIYKSTIQKLKTELDKLVTVSKAFNNVKQQRLTLFYDCFNNLKVLIDETYADIMNCPGCIALLTTDNEDEPYLGGIRYICIPPNKKCPLQINLLSGGEQTLASLAFIFALNRLQNRFFNFIMLDEVDAALDSIHRQKLCEYIRNSSNCTQVVMISLNRTVILQGDLLIGVYRKKIGSGSAISTLDLSNEPYIIPEEIATFVSSPI